MPGGVCDVQRHDDHLFFIHSIHLPPTMATKMTSDLERQFKKAVWLIRHGPPSTTTTTETRLKFYSLYKQATEGDVQGTQPWAVQVRAGLVLCSPNYWD